MNATPPPVDGAPVLAFDCAVAACSVAVAVGGRILAARFRALAQGQAEVLLPMIAEAMAEAGAAFGELGGLAVTVGPGSFTGVRVGLAAARGLALATGRPVAGLTTFEAIAAAVAPEARDGRPLVVAIDAKRGGELYLQVFAAAAGAPLGPPAVGVPAALVATLPPGPVLLAGDGQDGLLEALGGRAEGHAARQPDARAFAGFAAARLRLAPTPALPAPLYLRPPDVSLPPVAPGLRR